MWSRSNTEPVPNLPKAIVDFMALVSDKSWAKSMVQAAQDIAGANKLTEEEAGELKAAQEYVNGAQAQRTQMEEAIRQLEIATKKLIADQQAVTKREGQCDARNTEQGRAETALHLDRSILAKNQQKLRVDRQQLFDDQEQLKVDQAEVTAREVAVTKRENAMKQASQLIGASTAQAG